LLGEFVNETVPDDAERAISAEPARADRRRRGFMRGLMLVLLAASLGACTELNLFAREDVAPDAPADRLYNEGLYLLNVKKDTKAAVKKFEEVDRQHPYSDWARKSLLMTAYANYQAGNYDDCVVAAKRYVALHPGSADAAYAQYLMAASYFDQIPDITRDQAGTERRWPRSTR